MGRVALPLIADKPMGNDQQRDSLEEVQRHQRRDDGRDAQLHHQQAVEESEGHSQDRVIGSARMNGNPFRIISANTTALRLMALPTDRSMYPEIISSVNAPLRVRMGTAARRRLMRLSGLRKCPRAEHLHLAELHHAEDQ